MPINADKPNRWKTDIQQSVDLFNNWFMDFAPKAYRDTGRNRTRWTQSGLRRDGYQALDKTAR